MKIGQIKYGNLTLGPGTPYRWQELDGWDDLPGMDDGDEPRPDRHGEWHAPMYAEARYVTLSGRIRTEPGKAGEALYQLRRATAPDPTGALTELVVRTGDGEILATEARVDMRTIAHARGYRIGWVPLTLQWVCPDPRRYVPTPVQVVVPEGGTRPVPHTGDVATHPTVRIHGPCEDPVVTLLGATNLALSWSLTLSSGEWLDIDTDTGRVVDDQGDDRSGDAATGSVPAEYWALPPGDSRVAFDAEDAGSSSRAVVTYRHAHL